MTEAIFRVVHAGPHLSWQDTGRPGRMRFGVPASGPMDRSAFAIANLALGNPAQNPGVEVSLGGLTLDCLAGGTTVAVAGGGFVVETGGGKAGSWSVLSVREGDQLAIRPGPWGCWTYLAFAGTPQVHRWLGSAATHALSGLGGGRIAEGQQIVVEDARPLAEWPADRPADRPAEPRDGPVRAIPCPVWARPRRELHVVPGPQDRFFSPATMRALFAGPFSLTDAYDRMGVRLRGPSLPAAAALGIPSEPILRGSMQVSGDGVATILMADHQTTGGYPKIATVIDDDLDGFAQVRPHDPVAFRPVTADEAVRIARQRARARADYLRGLGRATDRGPAGDIALARPAP